MTLFEYLAIAFSLVFSLSRPCGLSLACLTRSSRKAVLRTCYSSSEPSSRHRCGLLGFLVFRNVEWNLARFPSALASPGLLYFLACTIIPETPSTVASWRVHFYSVRRSLYTGAAAWICIAALNNTISLGYSIWHPARAIQLVVLSLAAVGAVSENSKVHAILAIVFLSLFIAIAIVYFLPNPFAA